MTLMAGVDTHVDTLVISVVDDRGRLGDAWTSPNSARGFVEAAARGVSLGVDAWSVEGSGSYGRAFVRFLQAGGWTVGEAPTRLTATLRRVDGWAKNDDGDARAVARAGLMGRTHEVTRGETVEQLRVLIGHRESLVKAQTASLVRIRALLVELDPQLSTTRAGLNSMRELGRLARFQRRCGAYEATVAEVIRSTASTARRRLKEIRDLAARISVLAGPPGEALAQIPGIGPIGAATIIAHIGDISRFGSHAALANYAGTAPLDASSGRQQRHRLSRHGNRALNRVLYTAIITQIRHGGEAAAYVERRCAQGKTRREAIRAAKRHLTRRIYRTLKNTTQLT